MNSHACGICVLAASLNQSILRTYVSQRVRWFRKVNALDGLNGFYVFYYKHVHQDKESSGWESKNNYYMLCIKYHN